MKNTVIHLHVTLINFSFRMSSPTGKYLHRVVHGTFGEKKVKYFS